MLTRYIIIALFFADHAAHSDEVVPRLPDVSKVDKVLIFEPKGGCIVPSLSEHQNGVELPLANYSVWRKTLLNGKRWDPKKGATSFEGSSPADVESSELNGRYHMRTMIIFEKKLTIVVVNFYSRVVAKQLGYEYIYTVGLHRFHIPDEQPPEFDELLSEEFAKKGAD